MLRRLSRWYWRPRLAQLAGGDLTPPQAARVQAALAADPALRAEYRRLTLALGVLQAAPPPTPPTGLRQAIQADLALERRPVRSHYGDLLDGVDTPESGAWRAEIAADPELAGEFALVAAATEILRTEPVRPVPAELTARLRRDAAAAALARRAAQAEAPRRRRSRTTVAWAPRLAFAGTAAALLFGVYLSQTGRVQPVGPAPHPEATVIAAAPAVDSASTTPVTTPTPAPAPASVVTPAPAPVRVAAAPTPAVTAAPAPTAPATAAATPRERAVRAPVTTPTRVARAPEPRPAPRRAAPAAAVEPAPVRVAARPAAQGPAAAPSPSNGDSVRIVSRPTALTVEPLSTAPRPASVQRSGAATVSNGNGAAAAASTQPSPAPMAIASQPTTASTISRAAAMPDPSSINSIEAGSTAHSISFTSRTSGIDY